MIQIPVQDLRRVASALAGLKGLAIVDCVMRSDLRQLKIELADGRIVVIGMEADDTGRSHLAVDVATPLEDLVRQLDVGLDHRSD